MNAKIEVAQFRNLHSVEEIDTLVIEFDGNNFIIYHPENPSDNAVYSQEDLVNLCTKVYNALNKVTVDTNRALAFARGIKIDSGRYEVIPD